VHCGGMFDDPDLSRLMKEDAQTLSGHSVSSFSYDHPQPPTDCNKCLQAMVVEGRSPTASVRRNVGAWFGAEPPPYLL